MAELALTTVDIALLDAAFDRAHYRGRLTDEARAETVVTLRLAAEALALMAEPEPEHVCDEPYFCPTAGQVEMSCHGGFEVCCDRPDLHQSLAGLYGWLSIRGGPWTPASIGEWILAERRAGFFGPAGEPATPGFDSKDGSIRGRIQYPAMAGSEA